MVLNQASAFFPSICRMSEWSSDKQRRYKLGRFWSTGIICTVIGLNPSYADDRTDDPTNRRLIALLSGLGYGGYWLVNLLPNVTPYPAQLGQVGKRFSSLNKKAVWQSINQSQVIIFAWGSTGAKYAHRRQIYEMVQQPMCFGVTRLGEPRHPLYLPSYSILEPFVLRNGCKNSS